MNSIGHSVTWLATATIAATAMLIAAGSVSAADLGNTSPILGSVQAPLVRYDAYGYPVFAATAAHAIAPAYGSPACPLGSQPVYDANGNFVGHGPIRICQ